MTDDPVEQWLDARRCASTRRAHAIAIRDFRAHAGAIAPDLHDADAAAIVRWRASMAARGLGASTIAHRVAALASYFDGLVERAVIGVNPARAASTIAVVPASSIDVALKQRRDRAIVSLLLFHPIRRDEVCRLATADLHLRTASPSLEATDRRGRRRTIALQAETVASLIAYLRAARRDADDDGPVFRAIHADRAASATPLSEEAVYAIAKRCELALSLVSRQRAPRMHTLVCAREMANARVWIGEAYASTASPGNAAK